MILRLTSTRGHLVLIVGEDYIVRPVWDGELGLEHHGRTAIVTASTTIYVRESVDQIDEMLRKG